MYENSLKSSRDSVTVIIETRKWGITDDCEMIDIISCIHVFDLPGSFDIYLCLTNIILVLFIFFRFM